MSLDVYLTLPGVQNIQGRRILINERGYVHEISREDWDTRFPGREPVVVECPDDAKTVYSKNITHNLNEMAGEAGIYEALWQPEQIGVTHARQLIPLLQAGRDRLRADPERFKQFNPSNGWGNYEGLVSFVVDYLWACEKYPDAEVRVRR